MDTAFWALVAAIAVDTVIWVLDTFVISPSGFAEMREEMGQGAMRQVAMSAGFLVVTSALFLLLAFKMREGRGWARNGLAAVGALGMLFFVGSMNMSGFDEETAGEIVYALLVGSIPALLALGAILLMFLPTSNSYFSSAARTA
ncbi:hypothetical protein [Streptomyces lacrimifluminis]|uniref:hypothetical protein n=1 Tax=Streptomyces lacrimifluminis TaxID=1500077 RepID=UPI00166B3615|nr:hypothetical protein [Streptomyces lacrimifluminis]